MMLDTEQITCFRKKDILGRKNQLDPTPKYIDRLRLNGHECDKYQHLFVIFEFLTE